jgi:hypothetical protein
MSISNVRRFWCALLLLLSSLSSAPMASMEQNVPDAGGQVAQGHPMPTLRVGTAVELADRSVVPERPSFHRAPPGSGVLPAVGFPVPAFPCIPDLCPVQPADPDAVAPHCERLPYLPNAPPV